MIAILVLFNIGQAIALGWLCHKYSRLAIRERLRAHGAIVD